MCLPAQQRPAPACFGLIQAGVDRTWAFQVRCGQGGCKRDALEVESTLAIVVPGAIRVAQLLCHWGGPQVRGVITWPQQQAPQQSH